MLTRPIKLKFIEIHPAVLLLLFFSIIFDFIYYLSFTYAIVLIHELAHAIAAVALGVKIEKVEILPFGVTIKLSGTYIKKPIHEVIIALAGPVCNGIMALICYKLQLDSFFIIANIAIAAINLVPALPLDGGRVLKAILTDNWGYVKAFNFTIKVTRICAIILSIIGVGLLFYSKFNFSLLLIGAFLIVNTITEQRGSTHIMMNEILRSREKLAQGNAEHAGVIAISCDEPARKALKLLSYNRYYLINIIDNDMKIIGTLTETQLIEGLVKMGIRTKARKMIENISS